jgi:hypothetical protein
MLLNISYEYILKCYFRNRNAKRPKTTTPISNNLNPIKNNGKIIGFKNLNKKKSATTIIKVVISFSFYLNKYK